MKKKRVLLSLAARWRTGRRYIEAYSAEVIDRVGFVEITDFQTGEVYRLTPADIVVQQNVPDTDYDQSVRKRWNLKWILDAIRAWMVWRPLRTVELTHAVEGN